MTASDFTHLDDAGRARMVDVSSKEPTHRRAVAEGAVRMAPSTVALIRQGQIAKGDVLAVARIAGIQGAKRTADLVPLCHPLRLDAVQMEIEPTDDGRVVIRAEVRAFDRTGVEMEALTAVTVAALTVYDMCKAVDRGMRITEVRLTHKAGGKSGSYEAP